MTVGELSETILHIQHKPRWVWWAGFIITLLGIGLLWLWGDVTLLRCTRLTVGVVSCDLRSGWLGIFSTTQTFELWGARIEGEKVTLVTPGGRRPVLSSRWLTYGRQREITVMINRSVADTPQTSFQLSFVSWEQYGAIFLLLVVGLWGWLGVEGLVLKEDKNAGTLLVQRRRWGWWRVQEYPLSQIVAISAKRHWVGAKLWAAFRDGQTATLFLTAVGQKKCRHLAQTLSSFLANP